MKNSPLPLLRNWWQRHWTWAIPTGCLVLLLACAVFGGGIMLVVFRVMKSSEVYQTTLQRAKINAQVTASLGAPVTEEWWVAGNINWDTLRRFVH